MVTCTTGILHHLFSAKPGSAAGRAHVATAGCETRWHVHRTIIERPLCAAGSSASGHRRWSPTVKLAHQARTSPRAPARGARRHLRCPPGSLFTCVRDRNCTNQLPPKFWRTFAEEAARGGGGGRGGGRGRGSGAGDLQRAVGAPMNRSAVRMICCELAPHCMLGIGTRSLDHLSCARIGLGLVAEICGWVH